jgi:hypothetical protein
MFAMASTKTTTATGNVKYYVLDDDTVDNYDNWRFKMMLMFKNKGWNEPFGNPTVAIPTEAEANDPNATDEQKKMYKANDEAYNLFGMCPIPGYLLNKRCFSFGRRKFMI